jgi:hypothetical protein
MEAGCSTPAGQHEIILVHQLPQATGFHLPEKILSPQVKYIVDFQIRPVFDQGIQIKETVSHLLRYPFTPGALA